MVATWRLLLPEERRQNGIWVFMSEVAPTRRKETEWHLDVHVGGRYARSDLQDTYNTTTIHQQYI